MFIGCAYHYGMRGGHSDRDGLSLCLNEVEKAEQAVVGHPEARLLSSRVLLCVGCVLKKHGLLHASYRALCRAADEAEDACSAGKDAVRERVLAHATASGVATSLGQNTSAYAHACTALRVAATSRRDGAGSAGGAPPSRQSEAIAMYNKGVAELTLGLLLDSSASFEAAKELAGEDAEMVASCTAAATDVAMAIKGREASGWTGKAPSRPSPYLSRQGQAPHHRSKGLLLHRGAGGAGGGGEEAADREEALLRELRASAGVAGKGGSVPMTRAASTSAIASARNAYLAPLTLPAGPSPGARPRTTGPLLPSATSPSAKASAASPRPATSPSGANSLAASTRAARSAVRAASAILMRAATAASSGGSSLGRESTLPPPSRGTTGFSLNSYMSGPSRPVFLADSDDEDEGGRPGAPQQSQPKQQGMISQTSFLVRPPKPPGNPRPVSHQVEPAQRAFAPASSPREQVSGAVAHPDSYVDLPQGGGSLAAAKRNAPSAEQRSRMIQGTERVPRAPTEMSVATRSVGTPSVLMEYNSLFPSVFGSQRRTDQGIGDDDHMLYTPTYSKETRRAGTVQRPNKLLLRAIRGDDALVLYHNPHYSVGLGGRAEEGAAAAGGGGRPAPQVALSPRRVTKTGRLHHAKVRIRRGSGDGSSGDGSSGGGGSDGDDDDDGWGPAAPGSGDPRASSRSGRALAGRGEAEDFVAVSRLGHHPGEAAYDAVLRNEDEEYLASRRKEKRGPFPPLPTRRMRPPVRSSVGAFLREQASAQAHLPAHQPFVFERPHLRVGGDNAPDWMAYAEPRRGRFDRIVVLVAPMVPALFVRCVEIIQRFFRTMLSKRFWDRSISRSALHRRSGDISRAASSSSPLPPSASLKAAPRAKQADVHLHGEATLAESILIKRREEWRELLEAKRKRDAEMDKGKGAMRRAAAQGGFSSLLKLWGITDPSRKPAGLFSQSDPDLGGNMIIPLQPIDVVEPQPVVATSATSTEVLAARPVRAVVFSGHGAAELWAPGQADTAATELTWNIPLTILENLGVISARANELLRLRAEMEREARERTNKTRLGLGARVGPTRPLAQLDLEFGQIPDPATQSQPQQLPQRQPPGGQADSGNRKWLGVPSVSARTLVPPAAATPTASGTPTPARTPDLRSEAGDDDDLALSVTDDGLGSVGSRHGSPLQPRHASLKQPPPYQGPLIAIPPPPEIDQYFRAVELHKKGKVVAAKMAQ